MSPNGSALVRFVDGWHILSYDIGYEVDGKIIEFDVPKFYHENNKPNSPPIPYDADKLVKLMKKIIKGNVKKSKALKEKAN